jgi:hypothetical protein
MLEYFMTIWSYFRPFRIFRGLLVYLWLFGTYIYFPVLVCCTINIWQPRFHPHPKPAERLWKLCAGVLLNNLYLKSTARMSKL